MAETKLNSAPGALAEETDERLMAVFQGGNDAAYDLLVRRYKDQLLNFAFRYLGDRDDAGDVVQETFVRLYYKKASYRPVARFSTWLYTITTNLAKSQLRRRRRRSFFSLDRKGMRDERPQEIPDSRNSPDLEAGRSIQHEHIQRALDAIGAKYREIVILRDVQDLSYEEVCAITGLNMGTVKSRLNRARAQLRELLKDLREEPA